MIGGRAHRVIGAENIEIPRDLVDVRDRVFGCEHGGLPCVPAIFGLDPARTLVIGASNACKRHCRPI